MKPSLVIRSIIAVVAPGVCFFCAWKISSTQQRGVEEERPGREAVVVAEDPESIIEEMGSLPEWNLIAWKKYLRQLSADQLRDYLRENVGAASSERLTLAAERLGELQGAEAVAFLRELQEQNPEAQLHLVIYKAQIGWLKRDPRGALITAAADPDMSARRVPAEMLQQIAMFDPQLAAELLELPELADVNNRQSMLHQVGRIFGMGPAQQAFDWYESLSEADRLVIGPSLIGQQAAKDPIATAAMIDKLPPGQSRQAALTVATGWAAIDPQAALEWSRSLPQGDLAWDAQRVAIMRWADGDPKAAWDFVNSLDGKDRRAMLEEPLEWSLAREVPFYRKIDPFQSSGNGTLADSFLSHLPPAEQAELFTMLEGSRNFEVRRRAQRSQLFELARTDPAAAIEQTAELRLNEQRRQYADGRFVFPLQPLLDNAAPNDPAAAFELALTFPAAHRKGAVSSAMNYWADSDPAAAEAFIATMEPGRGRDVAFEGFARQVNAYDPQHAAEALVEYIAVNDGSTQLVRSLSSSITHAWFNQDPQAAGEWGAAVTDPDLRSSALRALHQAWNSFGEDVAAENLQAAGFSAEEIGALK